MRFSGSVREGHVMRIAALAIYSKTGDARVLRFGPGLNVVTGWSGTGKSSLLDIAEFCLGREHPTYPAGVLTRAVAWFAIEVEHDGARVVVARPAPAAGAATASGAMLAMGSSIEDLDGARLETNADAKTVRAELTRWLGIPANEVRPEGVLRGPLTASIGQALLFCFQAQGEIANKQRLFHRTDEEHVRDALRDTLPFFIGAVDLDTVALRRQLDDRKRELRRSEARLERSRLASGRAVEGTSSLIAEAAVLGLADAASPTEGDEAALLLRNLSTLPDAREDPTEYTSADVSTEPLRGRQRDLIELVAAIEHRLAALRHSTAERHEYGQEITEQLRRLTSIQLLPEIMEVDAAPACPLCGQAVHDDVGAVRSINHSLFELERRLDGLSGSEPAAAAVRLELESALSEAREALRDTTASIAAATRQDGELVRTGDLAAQRAFLRGRIAEFVAALPQSAETLAALEQEVDRRTREIARLEELLSPTSYRERTDSLMRVVSSEMSAWARVLRLEYGELGVQIDPTALTIVADTREGPVELARMGSAANIIGYHVAAHLALHKWFIEESRPVPGFVMFDQPSQAFYPEDVLGPEDEVLSDEDRARVAELYTLLRDVVAGLGDRLQIIVLDHANLNLPWFQAAIVANWRHGEALVPAGWLDEP